MLSAFSNAMKIPDLRKRILFTIALLFVCRLIANVPTPGVNLVALEKAFADNAGGGLMSWMNLFSGGALARCAVGSLSIWPYISASIILQLMTAVVPSLERMVREGETGRQKMQQYTRYLALAICVVQGLVLAITVEKGMGTGASLVTMNSPMAFRLLTVLTLSTGTMLMMWLGEQITERGLGNGLSLVIMTNIVSRLPIAVFETARLYNIGQFSIWTILALSILVFLVTMGTVMLTQGVRRIPIHTARRSVGQKVYGGQTNYMPLRINYSGVMPIIFAGPLIAFPAAILKNIEFTAVFASMLDQGRILHLIVFAILILFFSFFWVATQFNPMRIADDLKRNQSYVPGIRPGKPTADFLDHTMTRLTFIGAMGLMIVAILPTALSMMLKVPWIVTQFLGGTSLLIMVGVTLDTMRTVESHLLMRHYDGFLKKGRMRGRGGR